jgi:hypothetical protein
MELSVTVSNRHCPPYASNRKWQFESTTPPLCSGCGRLSMTPYDSLIGLKFLLILKLLSYPFVQPEIFKYVSYPELAQS